LYNYYINHQGMTDMPILKNCGWQTENYYTVYMLHMHFVFSSESFRCLKRKMFMWLVE